MSTSGGDLRIGEVAARAGVSPRTLRYYEELGLIAPSGHSPGGARRYGEADVARLRRIRDLQALMGFELDEIRTVLAAEDRLGQLRSEYLADAVDPERRRQIISEAIEINNRLRVQVKERLARAEEFLGDLERKARRYRKLLSELSAAEPGHSPSGR